IERHERAPPHLRVLLIERGRAGDLIDRTKLKMVLEVLADARQVMHDLKAERFDPLALTDAGELQKLWRLHSARSQDDAGIGAADIMLRLALAPARPGDGDG